LRLTGRREFLYKFPISDSAGNLLLALTIEPCFVTIDYNHQPCPDYSVDDAFTRQIIVPGYWLGAFAAYMQTSTAPVRWHPLWCYLQERQ
jgi:hypothetical protein